MTASEVAMNSAFPTPQPARKPMMLLIELDEPASPANITMSTRPAISVHLAPIRLDTQLVMSIATAVTTRYEVNSSVVSLGEVCSWCEIAGRIGSTRPMPMKDTMHANATANTALGCLNGLWAEPCLGSLMCGCTPRYCGGGARGSSPRRGPRRVVVTGDAGERVERGQRAGQRGPVSRPELGDDAGQPFGPDRAAACERRPALVGDDDEDDPPVFRARRPADQAGFLQPADQLGHGRLGDALAGGEQG